MRPGDLVRLDPSIFDRLASSRPGGGLSQYDIKAGRCPAARIDEHWRRGGARSWRKTVYLRKDRFYTVTKSRSTVMMAVGRTQVLCSVTGEEVYVKRDKLALV